MPFPAPPPVPPPVRILGLDPGLNVTGYAVLDPTGRMPKVCEAGVIRTDDLDAPDLSRRVKVLYDGLLEVIDQYRPGVLAVEQLFAHYDHPRTAVLMAHARGCFLLAAALRGVPVRSYPPARVKKTITGSGRAGKEQVQHAVMRELGLAKPPEPHDVADALAVALCHHYTTAATTMRSGADPAGTVTRVNRDRLAPTGDDAPDEAA
jgi:crossover junction endodeoxyribonuclease RuvC